MPDIDRWRGELEEITNWLNSEQWPQPEIDPYLDDMDWQALANKMESASDERRANHPGRSTPANNNSRL